MLMFQSMVTPDGLLFHLAGPVEGRRHDITLYRNAGTDEMLEAGMLVHGVRYCPFGDKAFLARPWLQVAFLSWPGVELDEEEEAYNVDMAGVRVAVEWGYKEVKQVLTSLDFKRKLKIQEGLVVLVYRTAVFFCNIRCCLYGRKTGTFFKCAPPSVGRYHSLP